MLSRGKLSVATWRRTSAALAAVLCVVLAANPAAAEDTGTATPAPTVAPAVGPATPGTVLCQVTNKDLDHVTGIAMGANGTIYAVESPSDTGVVEIWTVNQSTCEATKKRYGFQPSMQDGIPVNSVGVKNKGQPSRGHSRLTQRWW